MPTIHGASSITHHDGRTAVAITRTGGHLTAEFTLPDGRVVSPYSRSPWTPDETDPDLPALLRHLRGDFFCLPFGPQQDGPPHGDPANAPWQHATGSHPPLDFLQETTDTGCRVDKRIRTEPEHTALYIEHRVTGLSGRWSYGSHPILDFSNLPDGAGRVTTSPFRWASTYHGLFSNPANKEYQALQPNTEFTDLRKVPLAAEPPTSAENTRPVGQLETTDLTRYPARPGHDDLVMLVSEPATDAQPFAWTAAVLDGYAWFSLKNPADFPATLFWISNGGRHEAPWNGIHTKRLGLEEVCSYFCDDVAVSREDRLAAQGIPTTRAFHPDQASILHLVQAVAPVPANFGAVASIVPAGDQSLRISSDTGQSVETACNWRFVVDH
jgi:hypothetical protein